jgi:hypothetical protein
MVTTRNSDGTRKVRKSWKEIEQEEEEKQKKKKSKKDPSKKPVSKSSPLDTSILPFKKIVCDAVTFLNDPKGTI